MSDELTPDQILDKAADVIDINGWTRGEFRAETGEVCLHGALNLATYPENMGYMPDITAQDFLEQGQLFSALRAARANLEKSVGWNIGFWNDQCCGSQSEAADMLRQTAKRWREEHQ